MAETYPSRGAGAPVWAALLLVAVQAGAMPHQARASNGSGPETAPQAIALRTGDQSLVTNRSGAVLFAGRTIALAEFSGVFGLSSEVAYVVVTAGQASDGKVTARRGEMLLIPPLGGATTRVRYDAERLLAGLAATHPDAGPQIAGALSDIAAGQRRGVFWGRLGRTSFNVSAPGTAERELAARSLKGESAIETIRFSGIAGPDALERSVVAHFLEALRKGDIADVAALMDPLPFGNADLRGEPGDARTLMARRLVARHDWSRLLPATLPEPGGTGGEWFVPLPEGRVRISLRPLGDFIFVRTVSLEGRS